MFHKNNDVAKHISKGASCAIRIALKFGVDQHSALVAGCLHEISRVFRDDEKSYASSVSRALQ